jgi:hypothetical protein
VSGARVRDAQDNVNSVQNTFARFVPATIMMRDTNAHSVCRVMRMCDEKKPSVEMLLRMEQVGRWRMAMAMIWPCRRNTRVRFKSIFFCQNV